MEGMFKLAKSIMLGNTFGSFMNVAVMTGILCLMAGVISNWAYWWLGLVVPVARLFIGIRRTFKNEPDYPDYL